MSNTYAIRGTYSDGAVMHTHVSTEDVLDYARNEIFAVVFPLVKVEIKACSNIFTCKPHFDTQAGAR